MHCVRELVLTSRSNRLLVFPGALVHIVLHSMKTSFRAITCGYRDSKSGHWCNTSIVIYPEWC
jgi:hypothetical protein